MAKKADAAYDALLWLATTIWRQRRHGLPPDPGEQLTVHADLPPAVVVRVVPGALGTVESGVEPAGQAPAVLLRMPASTMARPAGILDTWETTLRRLGWSPVQG